MNQTTRHDNRNAEDNTALSAIRLDRMLAEFKQGRPVAVLDSCPGNTVSLLAPVETLSAAQLQQFSRFVPAGSAARLVLTAERLRALGLHHASSARALLPSGPHTVERLQRLAGILPGASAVPAQADLVDMAPASAMQERALSVAKRARLAPALLCAVLPSATLPLLDRAEVLRLRDTDLLSHALDGPPTLRRVSDAIVPIAASEDCTLVLFRDPHGDAEHVAIVVGQPDLSQAVPVRLHSSCLTGDLLGSLRCDCGYQLHQGIARLAETGGVMLYLSQEGRGTGLANKLRAYRLQDAGLDTIDADRHLGFSGDERDFTPAVLMLKELGISRIRLLTNNPRKIAFMRQAGLDVVDRVALVAPENPHNARYVRTKRERAGHLPHAAGTD